MLKPHAVIVDVDGTLVDVTSVRHHVLNRPKNFDAFHAGAEHCPPILMTLAVVGAWHSAADIIVVTARMRQWEASTRRWLDRHVPGQYAALHMRANGDYRPDFQVKRDILATIRETHDVALAIDDNPSVIALWESEGIPTVIVPGWLEEHAAPTPVCPECRDGKCRNCIGEALADDDNLVPCGCPNHEETP